MKNKWKIIIASVVLTMIILIIIGIYSNFKGNITKSNIEVLKQYENTNIGDNTKVINILQNLPYSKYRGEISLITSQAPYELIVKYNMSLNKEKMEYNSIALFSTISNLDKIKYSTSNDEQVIITREEYQSKIDLTLESLDKMLNKRMETIGEYEEYKITINNDGQIVFINSNLAYKKFKEQYKEALNHISKEFKLFPFNKLNYKEYMTYGWQVTKANEKLLDECSKVSKFLDIYENYDKTSTSSYSNINYILNDYPMYTVEIEEKNAVNNINNLKFISNNMIKSYFEIYNQNIFDNDQKIIQTIPLESEILAGDINEFIAKVDLKLIYEKPFIETIFGTVSSDKTITTSVMINIKQKGSKLENNEVFELKQIAKNIKINGLKDLSNKVIEERSY